MIIIPQRPGVNVGLFPRRGRGGAFDPLSLSPYLWVKADAGTLETVGGVVAADDADPVGEWQRQDGGSDHFVQATSTKRLTLKTAIQNGLPVLRGDGVDDFLSTGSNVAHGIGTGDFYWAGVIRKEGTAFSYKAVFSNGTDAPTLFVHGGKLNLYGAGSADRVFDTSLTNGVAYLIELMRMGTTLKAWINGVQEATTFTMSGSIANARASFATEAAGSSSSCGPHDFCEWIAAAGDKSSLQVATRSYLNSRWAVY